MSKVAFSLIDKALESGSLLDSDHDRIIELVHRDGIIDEIESKRLSELFNAIQSSNVKIVKSSISSIKSSDLESLKQDAVLRDIEVSSFTKQDPLASLIPQPSLDLDKTLAKDTNNIGSTEIEESNFQEDSLYSILDIPIHKEIDVKNPTRDSSTFTKASERMLEIDLNGTLWTRSGAMVAYRGDINFRREGITEHGLGKLIKRGFTGETTNLTKAEGFGKLFLADQGKKICIANLKGTPLYIQSEHILAFQPSVKWEIQTLLNVGTALAGGLFHLRFHGHGKIAFSTRFEPFVMRVTPNNPIITDVKATIGWSSGIVPSVKTDINFQTMIGRTSGETIQLRFEGDGLVIIQPYEENSSSES